MILPIGTKVYLHPRSECSPESFRPGQILNIVDEMFQSSVLTVTEEHWAGVRLSDGFVYSLNWITAGTNEYNL